ncbi:SRPBCC family protein [Novosphingobium cyanobacteriorum]|uniref:SRPBCC family protein n=1 Tax=Novosphingobium cyanobacteriorum TaxID=3024215 RepID=A0ABT6CNG6_9SPHN|nr:SRPBCC family protein [Novosphingobium cyanobacteriorum]MDF8335454.1 SRPBCC family protein [Novosphingobium cyanobacteriorum]
MIACRSSLVLGMPAIRVWRVIADVERYREWHPVFALHSDTQNPGKLLCTARRWGRGEAMVTADARLTRSDSNRELSLRIGIPGVLEFEESFQVTWTQHETLIAHGMRCIGLFSFLGLLGLKGMFARMLARTDAALKAHVQRATTTARYVRRHNR